MPETILPYCGAPPLPDAIWSRWNLDPVLIAALVAFLGCYFIGDKWMTRTRPARVDRLDAFFFVSGWTVLTFALISPLCALSVALFAARVGQHMTIAMVAALLIALGRPIPRLTALLPHRWQNTFLASFDFLAHPATAGVLFAAALWIWHTPYPYGATFRSDTIYWTMHVTMFVSAFLLWHSIAVAGLERMLLAVAIGFGTTLHMSLLGALLTFAGHPFFAEHLLTTSAWNLLPLEDQQLGGLIMWIPGCTILIIASIVLIGQFMHSLDRHDAALVLKR